MKHQQHPYLWKILPLLMLGISIVTTCQARTTSTALPEKAQCLERQAWHITKYILHDLEVHRKAKKEAYGRGYTLDARDEIFYQQMSLYLRASRSYNREVQDKKKSYEQHS